MNPEKDVNKGLLFLLGSCVSAILGASGFQRRQCSDDPHPRAGHANRN
jgi:hypothetical protein